MFNTALLWGVFCRAASVQWSSQTFMSLLLQGLVEVITSSNDHISVRATILLGELLHMVRKEGLFFYCFLPFSTLKFILSLDFISRNWRQGNNF